MSGHSKWATTKHKKAIVDAKRGKLFTKFGKLITIAARDGKSGDPTTNPSLRMAILNAKSASMPKENIDRAILRGTGGAEGAQIEEVIYEAYAPGGIAIFIECLTDNKNRTLSDIKAILNKGGGTLATTGSVAYLFERIGQIIIDENKNETKGEDLELAIIDSGASDFDKEESIYVVTCQFTDLHQVAKTLEDAGVVVESTEVIRLAKNLIELPPEKQEAITSLVDKIEESDDVSNVFTNLDINE